SLKHYIIKNNKKDAALFLSKLSKLIRTILDNSQRKEITLLEELNIMKLYLEVENMRSDKSILLEITVEDGITTNTLKLPPLVLQPLIENAIWHGLSLIKENKRIKIEVNKNDSYLIISIEDNGIGRIRTAQLNDANFIEKESLGIDITKQRLQAYTSHLKNKVSIAFEDLYENDKPIGTKVFVKIPLV
ncbi:MAG TPA: sensor histidine kinase, partial [Lutibacter sp.]|nr:sensor histidine kinase [Lutibacter sp.]